MKKIISLLAIAIIVGSVIGYKIYNKPHQDIRSAKSMFQLPATELFSSYEADETSANEKFLGKIVEVTGKVQEVSKDENGVVNVTLDAGGMLGGVICKLDELTDHKRTDLNKNEQVTLKGECTGMLMDVVLVRCVEL